MFRSVHRRPPEGTCRDLLDNVGQDASGEFASWVCAEPPGSSKPIREKLTKDYARLDPAIFSPPDPAHPLRRIEDHFSQSIELGLTENWNPALTPMEVLLLRILDSAERQWDFLARDVTRARQVIQLLRQTASIVVKRSVGIRRGNHAMEEYLQDYEASLRDLAKLRQVTTTLRPLLGENGFRFNVVESFGQPQAEGGGQRLVTLEGATPDIVPHPAPAPSDSSPGHDIPSFEITDSGYRMPLTFDFYMALKLRSEGCAGSSLPASVRAALDRVRHRIAGSLFRDRQRFVGGSARVVVGGRYMITLSSLNADPAVSTT
jgi:hypothetical protein